VADDRRALIIELSKSKLERSPGGFMELYLSWFSDCILLVCRESVTL
jgi:hypothetical protein